MKINYGPDVAQTYERDRRSTLADVLFWEIEEHELFYAINMSRIDICNILEAGCGTGRFLTNLAKKGYAVHGADISPHMLTIAYEKSKNQLHNISVYRTDIQRLPFRDNTFDFVYCIRVMNQLPSKTYALKSLLELCRVCKKHGTILLEYVNSWGISRFSRKSCTYLSIRDIERTLRKRDYEIKYLHGVLFFSQSIWGRLAVSILPAIAKLDAIICKFLPRFSTRNYVYITIKQRKPHK